MSRRVAVFSQSSWSQCLSDVMSYGQYDAILSQEINVSLADRTNGRAYATVLRPSVVRRRRRL